MLKVSDEPIRLAHERERLAFSVIPPPAGRDRPHSETNFANGQVGMLVGAKFHCLEP